MKTETKFGSLIGWIAVLLLLNPIAIFAQTPVIEFVDKESAAVGDTIYIAGSGFDNDPAKLKVIFGAAAGTIVSSSTNLIEVVLPAGATYRNITVTHLTSGLTAYSHDPVLLSYGGTMFDETKIAAPSNFASTSELYDVCLCDFDGDGMVDIATANNNSNLFNILRNTTAAGVVSFATSTISVNSSTINVNCGDLNGDGKPEIILSKSGSPGDRIFYLKNNSTPGVISFSPPTSLIVNGNIARRTVIRDLDFDGKPEIIVTNQSNNFISIFKNKSTISTISFDPFISLTVDNPSGTPPNTAGLAVDDFNMDGLPDIAVSHFLEKNIYFLFNESSVGSIAFGSSQAMAVAGNLVNLASVDIDGDGKPEILATKLLQNSISVFKNDLTDGSTDLAGFTEMGFTVNDRPWGLDFGDLNGDGKIDIAVGSINDLVKRISILENTSTPGDIQLTTKYITTPEKTRNLRVGDINGDAKPDLTVTSIDLFNVSVFNNQNCVFPAIEANTLEHCIGSKLFLKTNLALEAEFVWYRDNVEVKRSVEPFYLETMGTGGMFQYKVEVNGEGGSCSETSSTVEVNVIPGTIPNVPSIVDPGPLCEGEPLNLTVGNSPALPGDATFLWTLPDGSTQPGNPLTIASIGVEDVGRYKLLITSGGCQSAEQDILIETISVPDFRIGASNGLQICDGNNTQLAVPNDVSFSYQWKMDGTNITGETSNSITVSTSGSYAVEITTASMCVLESEPAVVQVVPKPAPSFNSSASECVDNMITFENTSTTDNSVTVEYSWDFGDGNTSTDVSPTHQYTASGTYNISLTVNYPDLSCNATSMTSIDIADPPVLSIIANGDLTFCEGGSVELSIAGSFPSIIWSTLEATNAIIVDQSDTYTVQVTTADNCTVSAQEDVTVNPAPVIAIVTVPEGDTVIRPLDNVQLMASGTGVVTYSWTPTETLDNPDIASPLATPDTTTTYVVEGTDGSGCIGTSQIKIRIEIDPSEFPVFPKKVFSPNLDGIDDQWRIDNIESFPESTVMIYNRAGKKIFEQKGYAQDWDATFEGNDLPAGPYYFVIVSGEKKKAGSVLVIR